MNVKLSVEGMACPNCSGRVQKFLESKSELSEVTVSLEGKEADFSCEEGVNLEEIVKGINEMGFQSAQK